MDSMMNEPVFGSDSFYYEDELLHYGTPHLGMTPHSGRYPYGSGDNPGQHEAGASIAQTYTRLRKQGLSHKQIAEYLDMTTTELTNRTAYSRELDRNEMRMKIKGLRDGSDPLCAGEPMGWKQIGDLLGMPESSVRTKYEQLDRESNYTISNAKKYLEDRVGEVGYLDVGLGTATLMGITQTKLQAAIQALQDDGYAVGEVHVPQPLLKDANTTVQYIAPPGTTVGEVWAHRGDIRPVVGSYDQVDENFSVHAAIKFPVSVDPKRLQVRYAEDGGTDKDGVIEIRPGVPDLSLGANNYAQVRIAVGEGRYLKGMGIYSDDLPDGVDLLFNTNKTRADHPDPLTTLKKFKTIVDDDGNTVVDRANPFGSALKTENGIIVGQSTYIDPKTGKEKQSAINICREEGDWDQWSRNLASQFLSKQNLDVAKRQLDLDLDRKKDELSDIKALTNPEIKKKLLDEYADDCEASAVNLKAAPFPHQSTKVLLPAPSLPDNECYCPYYQTGEDVALVRFPHGGTFEIPVLTVNNNRREAKRTLGNTQDGIGISPNTASRLSGADFDGDTAVVIPMRDGNIKATAALEGLRNFDSKQYSISENDPKFGTIGLARKETNSQGTHGDGFNTQREMGVVSNLITDMTIKGGDQVTTEELARAVRYSMVVIDAEKHQLDHEAARKENNIAELVNKYQKKDDPTKKPGGASTLISRAKSPERIPHRREVYSTQEMTPEELARWKEGEVIYRDSGRTTRGGKPLMVEVPKMLLTNDARTLISTENTKMERVFADYANDCKQLAKEARKTSRNLEMTKVDPKAKEAYAKEVDELNAQIDRALANKPYERNAITLASAMVAARKKDHPEWEADDIKKAKVQATNQARAITKANKYDTQVELTDRQWEAIHAGALTSNKIMQILNNTDNERFKQLAMPRNENKISTAKVNRIKHLLEASGQSAPTIAEIAQEVGVPVSTVNAVAQTM